MRVTLHNPSEVLLGTVGVSDAEVTNEIGDPSSFPAGLAVRCASTGNLSLASGNLIGISLGRSIHDPDRTAVARLGQQVPLQLTDEGDFAVGEIEITSYANLVDDGNDTIEVAGVVFTAQSGASTLGEVKFTADTSNDATATSLADQINAHTEASKLVIAVATGAKVAITAKTKGEDGNDLSLAYADEGTATIGATVTGSGTLEGGVDSYDYVVEGAPVEIDLATGKAVSDGQATGAIYCHNGHKVGIVPGFYGKVDVAQVDMIGGL